MIRGYMGRGFGLDIQGLKNGSIQVKHYTNQKTHETITEYWIYRTQKTKTGLVNARGGQIYKDDNRPRLFCIITADTDKLLMDKKLNKVFVQGVRFSGRDINIYLRETGRGVDDFIPDPHEVDVHENNISKTMKKKGVDSMEKEIDDYHDHADD